MDWKEAHCADGVVGVAGAGADGDAAASGSEDHSESSCDGGRGNGNTTDCVDWASQLQGLCKLHEQQLCLPLRKPHLEKVLQLTALISLIKLIFEDVYDSDIDANVWEMVRTKSRSLRVVNPVCRGHVGCACRECTKAEGYWQC